MENDPGSGKPKSRPYRRASIITLVVIFLVFDVIAIRYLLKANADVGSGAGKSDRLKDVPTQATLKENRGDLPDDYFQQEITSLKDGRRNPDEKTLQSFVPF